MQKKLLLSALICLVTATMAFSQSVTVTGKVTDATSNEPIPYVNVFISEIAAGAPTDIDGNFTISNVPVGTYTFKISSIGYIAIEREISVGTNNNVFNFSLEKDVKVLEDFVVTAFGLSRKEKSIGYAVQEVSGDLVNRVDQGNVVGALAGKVAGVQVVGSAGSNIGGSERIRIRGTNGLSDGQPLFVVDGTPMSNSSFMISGGGSARGRDLGNLMSDLNIQNIESISVLKGAAASALYGNQASNGVIIITTKKGGSSLKGRDGVQIDFSNSTYFENVSLLPEYQNEYAGGYTQDFIQYTDPRDGKTYNGLNYAADESWGPKMDGTEYRPYWSWYDSDFTGDGKSDYGTTIPLKAQPNNIEEFFETGLRLSNTLSVSGVKENMTYRVSLNNTNHSGVFPNSKLEQTSVSFNGSVNHSDRLTSRSSANYVNTKGKGRPAQGYSPMQGSPVQSFNQWFQRQLDMSKLKQYKADDGSFTSWNIRSNTNTRPLYWDSPYFSVYENVSNDDRNRLFGNYTLSLSLTSNLELTGKVHLDTYDFIAEDRIASGGLEEDWYYVAKRSRREVNYEGGAQFAQDFQAVSFSAYVGANMRQVRYNSLIQQTVGGLSVPNYFNIGASIDRPDVSSYKSNKDVHSVYGTATLGFFDMLYIDGSVRNDWSSALPTDDNSYLYYGLSTSFVFTELLPSNNLLSFGKVRASVAQVGNDLGPYQVYQTYGVGTTYGSSPTLNVPNSLSNQNLIPAVSTDIEFGADVRFFNGRLRTDVNYYNSVREDEILDLTVPGASGFSTAVVNAGEFTTEGYEVELGFTAIQSDFMNVDFGLNWAKSTSTVNKLSEGITSRLLESGYFGLALYAEEGREWGNVVTTGSYGGYQIHEGTGKKIIAANGHYARETNKDLGNILPDWTGGFRMDISMGNISLGTFIEFQKGGQFYSITKMFNAYSGLGKQTVGNNVLGNPLRDPVLDSAGNEVTFVARADADPKSGGVLVEGVDEDGNPVANLYDAVTHFGTMFRNKEAWLYDASYVKLKEIKVTFNVPASWLTNMPLTRASLALDVQNVLLLYSSIDDMDPSAIQNNATGFAFWEGGGLPPTRSVGFNVNLSF